MNKTLFYFPMLFLFLLGQAAFAAAPESAINADSDGVALKGYDAVAYFQDSKAVKGTKEFEFSWMGAKWRFASAANRDLFSMAPEKYAPQFGGYCAYGVSQNHLAPIDPKVFTVLNGKLYLNYDAEVGKLFSKDIQALIQQADQNWPGLIKK